MERKSSFQEFIKDKVFLVAEIGINHNGKLKLAESLIDKAVECGADAVKFQTFYAKKLFSRYGKGAQHIEGSFEKIINAAQEWELSFSDFEKLKKYAEKKGIIFFSTPADIESGEFLNNIGVPIFKIGSGDLTNKPLIQKVASFKKPVIISTGLSTLKEVKRAVKWIEQEQNKNIAILHCVSTYPARAETINLRAILLLKEIFSYPIGYSDHSSLIEICLGAASLGANIIEVHFTLDKSLPGPDHKASLNPEEMKILRKGLDNIFKALGKKVKEPSFEEKELLPVFRRSVFAKVHIPKGTVIKEQMLICKRPRDGIEPFEMESIIGKRAKVDIKEDEVITWNKIE